MRINIFIFILFLSSCRNDSSILIGEYSFKTPLWWNEIEIEVPESIKATEEARRYASDNFGSDVGTEKTWKTALKFWALFEQKKKNGFPVFIGHCFVKGQDYENAAKVYQDLYFLSNTQKDNVDWYKSFLSYNAGEVNEKLGDLEEAKKWYSLSAQIEYLDSKDNAIRYYSRESYNRFKKLTGGDSTQFLEIQ